MKQQSKRRTAPKKIRAIQTSRHLRVVPHRHTGRMTHRRTTSYPTLFMIVLCLGVFLASWTSFVTADSFVYPGPVSNSYTVKVSVPGPPPTQPAVIDTPDEGETFKELPITVAGTCPLDTYINIYRNNVYSGTALCDPNGRFSLQSSLFSEANELSARVFSMTDVPGPLDDPVMVMYDPPVPPPTSNGGTGNTGSSGGNNTTGNASNTVAPTAPRSGSNRGAAATAIEPLLFKTNFKYTGQYVGQPSSWQLDLSGGTAPYAISVDWGDNTRDLISRPKAGVFSLDHIYKKAGGYKGSYVVKFTATDADGNTTFLQLLSIVNNPPGAAGVTKKQTPSIFSDKAPDYLNDMAKYIWPGYGIVLLMLTSFWLGERREYHHLKPRLKKGRHA